MTYLAIIFLTLAASLTIGRAADAAAAHNAGQTAPRWERYTAAGEEFSALLPKLPSVSLAFRPPRPFAAPKRGLLYAAYEDGTAYVVLSFENPNNEEDLQVFISEFQDYGVFYAGLTFERELTLHGYQGKQYRLKSATTELNGVAQFYRTRKHVYVFEAVGDERSRPAIERFLKSVTLDMRAKAKNITSLQADAAAAAAAAQGSALTPPPDSAQQQPTDAQPEKPYPPKEVIRKAVIVARETPQYTEEARKNQISGTVVLKAVFSSSGTVTGIRAVSGLPYGLTEKAIAAARHITFIPAIKDGHFVSQYIQIEYNFNLY